MPKFEDIPCPECGVPNRMMVEIPRQWCFFWLQDGEIHVRGSQAIAKASPVSWIECKPCGAAWRAWEFLRLVQSQQESAT